MNGERCHCGPHDGKTLAELRDVKSCKDRWICNELDKARRIASRKEATRSRIAALKGADNG